MEIENLKEQQKLKNPFKDRKLLALLLGIFIPADYKVDKNFDRLPADFPEEQRVSLTTYA